MVITKHNKFSSRIVCAGDIVGPVKRTFGGMIMITINDVGGENPYSIEISDEELSTLTRLKK